MAVGSKTGHLFLFERLTGRPFFPTRERPVPASDVPGEHAAATQPFPDRPASLVPQQISEADIWGAPRRIATPVSRRSARYVTRVRSLHPACAAVSWLRETSAVCMGRDGVGCEHTHDHCAVNRLPAIVRLVPKADFERTRRANPHWRSRNNAVAVRHVAPVFPGPVWYPLRGPAMGRTRGDSRGHRRDGLADDAGGPALCLRSGVRTADGIPQPGGPVVTSTGLVFIGATIDPYLRAFETKSGRQVWEGRLPTGARATPLLFTTARGREMVAVAAGGSDSPLSKLGSTLVVFGLRDQ